MAVDTRSKRLSMLSFADGSLLPDPSGTVGAAARATLLHLYGGVVETAEPLVSVAAFTITLVSDGREIDVD